MGSLAVIGKRKHCLAVGVLALTSMLVDAVGPTPAKSWIQECSVCIRPSHFILVKKSAYSMSSSSTLALALALYLDAGCEIIC